MNKYISPVYIKLSEYIFLCRKKNVDVNIALVLLDKIEQFPIINIEEVALQAHTSPSSITKFCKKLGYNRFSDLKKDHLPFTELTIKSPLPARIQEMNVLDIIYRHLPLDTCYLIAKLALQAKRMVLICNDYSFNNANILREGLSGRHRTVWLINRNSSHDLLEKFIHRSDMVLVICLTGAWYYEHQPLFLSPKSKTKVLITATDISGRPEGALTTVLNLSTIPHFFSSNYYSNKILNSTFFQIVQYSYQLLQNQEDGERLH